MLSAIGTWFITTRLGQTVILAAAITATAFGTYFYIDGKAYTRGYDKAKSECASAQSDAKTGELNKRAEQSQDASKIASNTAAESQKVVTGIDNQTKNDQEKNHEEYRAQPPVADRVACVDRDLPSGVQARIDAAVERLGK